MNDGFNAPLSDTTFDVVGDVVGWVGQAELEFFPGSGARNSVKLINHVQL